MFGYVVINKPEIKFKDFDLYRSYYCGPCRDLKEDFHPFRGVRRVKTLFLRWLYRTRSPLYYDQKEASGVV